MSDKIRVSPNLPLKIRLLLAAHSFGVDNSRRPNLTVNRAVSNLVDPKASPSKEPIKGVKSSDIIIDTARNLWFRLFTPTTATTGDKDGNENISLPIIFYFHGGGFAFMGANSKNYHDLCHQLARKIPAVVISVNYRLAPEHRFPCQYEDGFEALKFIDALKSVDLPPNADLSRCFVAGDSAGGNLAHHVALKVGEYEFSNLKVIGLIAIQPFFGGEERTESEIRLAGAPLISVERTDWMWKAFLPDGSDRDHPVANVFGPKSVDISGVKFPVTLLFVGGFDPLQDWQRRYYEGLKQSGKEVHLVEYPNAIHGFYGFAELPETSLLIKEVKDFIQKQLV